MPGRHRHQRDNRGGGRGGGAGGGGGGGGGKRGSGQKGDLYSRPLPLPAQCAPSSTRGGRGGRGGGGLRRNDDTQQHGTSQGWSDYLTSFVPPLRALLVGTPQRRDYVIAHWDPLTRSVWVGPEELENARDILWRQGFFGKGNLSRSEPTWASRALNAKMVMRVRERGGTAYTPEEMTAMRRKERQAAKIERAKLAVRAGTQLADGIVALGGTLQGSEKDDGDEGGANNGPLKADEDAYGKHIPGLIYLKPTAEEKKAAAAAKAISDEQAAVLAPSNEVMQEMLKGDEVDLGVEPLEFFHLSREETLFLAGMMEVLEVRDDHDRPLPLSELYSLLLVSSLPLPLTLAPTPPSSQLWARADNPFLLHYVAYHHYRSLGWVVRAGSKFCVDLLLYKRGPVFSHAEFSILVIPVYDDPADAASSPFAAHANGGRRSWVWFSSMNRVNSQVLKTLVLCHVHIPSLASVPPTTLSTPQGFVEALRSGSSYHVREVAIRRWVPARMRA